MIAVFGLGIVGLVTATGLAKKGFSVIGVDSNKNRISALKAGKLPFFEPELKEEVVTSSKKGLQFSESYSPAPDDTVIICVGTPSLKNGTVNLSQFNTVIDSLSDTQGDLLIVRSTVPPGTMEQTARKMNGFNDIIYYPEFIRQGSALRDSKSPPISAYSSLKNETSFFFKLFDNHSKFTKLDFTTLELLKYACNGFHALKVSFTNEIHRLCMSLGADSKSLFAAFQADQTLNCSTAYLNPGPPYGGPCLEKDLLELAARAKDLNLNLPVISNIQKSNDIHLQEGLKKLQSIKGKVLFIGIGFKYQSGDTRNSPLLRIAHELASAIIYDPLQDKVGVLEEHLSQSMAIVLGAYRPSQYELKIILKGPKLVFYSGFSPVIPELDALPLF